MTTPQKDNPQSSISIKINSKLRIHPNFNKCLIFQLLIALYYVLLVVAEVNNQSNRIVIYCLLFILNQTVKHISQQYSFIDPLGIEPVNKCINLFKWGVIVNISYQLILVAYFQQHLPAFLMFIHFVVANIKKSRPGPDSQGQKGKLYFKIMDYVNPILIYSFLKQFDTERPQLSIVFLLLMCINLLFCSEIRLILSNHESDVVGWLDFCRTQGNPDNVWDRVQAFKLLVLGCSTVIVIENVLLIFESIRNQVYLNTVHSLLLGIVAFLMTLQKGDIL